MMDGEFDLTPYMRFVPEGCTPTFGIMVFGWINEDGEMCGGWHLDGEDDSAIVVGQMEIAQQRIILSAFGDPNDES